MLLNQSLNLKMSPMLCECVFCPWRLICGVNETYVYNNTNTVISTIMYDSGGECAQVCELKEKKFHV